MCFGEVGRDALCILKWGGCFNAAGSHSSVKCNNDTFAY
jgi:hypothetical protein